MKVKQSDLSTNAAMVMLRFNGENPERPWGELFNMYEQDPIPCENAGDFLLQLDALYDKLNFPMATMEKRSFFQGETKPSPACEDGDRCDSSYQQMHDANAFNIYATRRTAYPKRGEDSCATFYIHTIFRRNASWQGRVLWSETERECYFRSALELLHLIDGAIKSAGKSLKQPTRYKKVSTVQSAF